MSHETGGPKHNCQEPRGSMYDCITFVPKETCQKSNRQETVGTTYDRLKFVPNNIHNVSSHNKITAPFISNNHKTYTMQKCNSMHVKYLEITKIRRHQNVMHTSS